MTTTAIQRAGDAARLATVRRHDDRLKQTTLADLLAAHMPPREPLLEGLLKTGESMMLWAAPGVGKTMASLSIALAVAGGGSWLHWPAEYPRRVLIVDGEMNMHDLRDRFAALAKGAAGGDMQRAAKNIAIVARQDQDPDAEFPDLGEKAWQDRILKRAQRWEAELVILDNFSTLAEVDDENAASAMSPVLSFLLRMKAAGIATILVHHSGKSGESYRGSSKLEATFEVVAGLKHPKDAASRHGTAFDLTFGKFRGKRGEAHAETTAWLEEDARTGSLKWDWKKSEAAILNQVVAAIRSERFPFDKDAAKSLGMTTSTFNRKKDRAIAERVISREEWEACLAAARDTHGPGSPADLAEETDDALYADVEF
jgi:KaiC/GvpD/RAD55 family RecA-like ATPase